MLKLEDREWKDFFISSIFSNPKRGKRILNKNHIQGNIPLVSSAGTNNGVTAFIGNTERVRTYSNCISVANGGSSAGKSFYEPFKFIASDHITHFKKPNLSENQYLALAAVMTEKLTEKYSFSREITDYRISREKIMLPVTEKGNPDFEFLEQYIEEHKKNLKEQYISFVEKQLNKMEYQDIPKLNNLKWNAYKIQDLFVTELKNGKIQVPTGANVCKEKLQKGNTPRITVTSNNNGIYGYYNSKDKNYRIFKNIISVSFLGDAFYHPYKCSLDMKVHSLILKERTWNLYLAEFFVNEIINNTKHNDFGNQLSATDLPSKSILIPETSHGIPDYNYMQQYTQNIVIKKYKQYLNFIKFS